jgi:hypothetical protein
MDCLKVEIIPSTELPPLLHDEIMGWLIATFIEDDDDTMWASVDWHVLGWIEGQLVCHVDMLRRSVRVGAREVATSAWEAA